MTLLSAIFDLLTPVAYGQISSAAAGVSNGLTGGPGTFLGIVNMLRAQVWPILIIAPIFFIVRAGLQLINSQDEGKLQTAKRIIASSLVGLMLIPLADPIFNAIFNPSREGLGDPSILTNEIGGIINWVLVLVVPIAILMIVASAIRAVSSFGKDDGTATVRQSVYGVILGLGLLIFAGAIKATLGLNSTLEDVSPDGPGPVSVNIIIMRGVMVAQNVLMFLALLAVAVVIYAGFIMVLSIGDDEKYNRAKGIVVRVLIGLTIVLMANLIIWFVVKVVTA